MRKRLASILLCAAISLTSVCPVYADVDTPNSGENAKVVVSDTTGNNEGDNSEDIEENSAGDDANGSEQNLQSDKNVIGAASGTDETTNKGTGADDGIIMTAEGMTDSTSVSEDEFDMSNEELFEMYAAKELGLMPGISMFSLSYAASHLGEDSIEYKIYQEMIPQIKDIAAGKCDTAVFQIPVTKLLNKTSFTAEELGVSSIVADGSMAQDASDSLYEKLMFDLSKELYALLADCPYELYWYRKSAKGSFGVSYPSCRYSSAIAMFPDDAVLTISLIVDDPYMAGGDQYSVNTAKTGAASTAAQNAESIVTAAKTKSDYEKLKYYKDEICSLVSYDHDCIKDDYTGSLSPWQIINVFDNDPATNVVCEGYAKAFAYLCERTEFYHPDIMVYTVTGQMGGGTGAGPHMWNVAHMDDGNNYLVDVTNCDSGSIGYSDELFVKKRGSDIKGQLTNASGVVVRTLPGYSYSIKGQQIYFYYDAETLDTYDFDSELNLSSVDYEETEVVITKADSEITGGEDTYAKCVGETFSLGLDGHKKGSIAENLKIKYTSSNEDVATVDDSGNVTAVGVGSATITAIIEDSYMINGCSREITVTSSYMAPPDDTRIMYNGQAKKEYYSDNQVSITADGYTIAEDGDDDFKSEYVLELSDDGDQSVATVSLRFKNSRGAVSLAHEISVKYDHKSPVVETASSSGVLYTDDLENYPNGYYKIFVNGSDNISGITDCYLFVEVNNAGLSDIGTVRGYDEYIDSSDIIVSHVQCSREKYINQELRIDAEKIAPGRSYNYAVCLIDAVGHVGYRTSSDGIAYYAEGFTTEAEKDTVAPTASISVGANTWETFLDEVTFDVNFKGSKKVTVTASDSDSGLQSIGYKISNTAISRDAIKLATDWENVSCASEKDKTISFYSPESGQAVVYVKVVDMAGCETYISSNGMVIEEISGPAVESASLTISEGSIGINFYIAYVPDAIAEAGSVKIEGKGYKFPEKEDDETYKFTYYVNAKEMDDKLAIELLGSDGNKVNLTNESAENGIVKYSVTDYIHGCEEADESIRGLMNAIDTYGKCARKYFKYNAPDEETVVADCNLAGFKKIKSGALPAAITYAGSTIVLKDTFKIRHYFKMDNVPSDLSVTVDGKETALLVAEDGLRYIEIAGVKSSELGKTYELRVSDNKTGWSLKYSVLSYAYDAMIKSTNKDLCNLVKSIYWYDYQSRKYMERT